MLGVRLWRIPGVVWFFGGAFCVQQAERGSVLLHVRVCLCAVLRAIHDFWRHHTGIDDSRAASGDLFRRRADTAASSAAGGRLYVVRRNPFPWIFVGVVG